MAWWKLDEAQGADAADASKHYLKGRVEGQARWGAGRGKVGGALEFDGRTHVDCGDAPQLGLYQAMTVSFWLKSSGLKKNETLIAKGSDTWRIYSEGEPGQLVFVVNGPLGTGKDKGKPVRLLTKRAVADGQWHHVLGVFDGKHAALYLDGTQEASMSAAGVIALNTDAVWLGNNSASRGQGFSGSLDDVRLYACALDEKAIQGLARAEGK